MKKIIIAATAVVFLLMAGYYAYYHEGFYLRLGESDEVTSFMSTDADTHLHDARRRAGAL